VAAPISDLTKVPAESWWTNTGPGGADSVVQTRTSDPVTFVCAHTVEGRITSTNDDTKLGTVAGRGLVDAWVGDAR
jgi:hypothetical protein